MPLYLYRIQPTRPQMLAVGPASEEEHAVAEHFAYHKGLTDAGVLLLAGRTQTCDYSSFGIVIFHAWSDAAAEAVVAVDPAVRQRVVRAELYPYRIALLGAIQEHTE